MKSLRGVVALILFVLLELCVSSHSVAHGLSADEHPSRCALCFAAHDFSSALISPAFDPPSPRFVFVPANFDDFSPIEAFGITPNARAPPA